MNLYKVTYQDDLNKKKQEKECIANDKSEIIEKLQSDVSFNRDIIIELIDSDIDFPYFIE